MGRRSPRPSAPRWIRRIYRERSEVPPTAVVKPTPPRKSAVRSGATPEFEGSLHAFPTALPVERGRLEDRACGKIVALPILPRAANFLIAVLRRPWPRQVPGPLTSKRALFPFLRRRPSDFQGPEPRKLSAGEIRCLLPGRRVAIDPPRPSAPPGICGGGQEQAPTPFESVGPPCWLLPRAPALPPLSPVDLSLHRPRRVPPERRSCQARFAKRCGTLPRRVRSARRWRTLGQVKLAQPSLCHEFEDSLRESGWLPLHFRAREKIVLPKAVPPMEAFALVMRMDSAAWQSRARNRRTRKRSHPGSTAIKSRTRSRFSFVLRLT